MFSKALFKQSCKANGTMWGIITFAVCFMLACVMLISGGGNIGEVKDSIQDTIIVKEVDAQLENRALSYYRDATDGLERFDSILADNATDTLSYLTWCANMPDRASLPDDDYYAQAIVQWKALEPEMKTDCGKKYAESITSWKNAMPDTAEYSNEPEYLSALFSWNGSSPATEENAVRSAYVAACDEIQKYVTEKAESLGYPEDSDETLEMLGCVMYTLDPNGTFDDFYKENGENVPDEYDILGIISHIASGDAASYVASDDRTEYRNERAQTGAAVFIAGNMSRSENVETLTEALSSYGVTKEKYDSFGYTYDSIRHMAMTAIVTYDGRIDYETDLLRKDSKTENLKMRRSILRL